MAPQHRLWGVSDGEMGKCPGDRDEGWVAGPDLNGVRRVRVSRAGQERVVGADMTSPSSSAGEQEAHREQGKRLSLGPSVSLEASRTEWPTRDSLSNTSTDWARGTLETPCEHIPQCPAGPLELLPPSLSASTQRCPHPSWDCKRLEGTAWLSGHWVLCHARALASWSQD